MSDQFFFAIPAEAILAVLNSIPKDEPYPEHAAVMSLMLDIDSNDVKPLRAYSRIWKWGHKKTRIKFDEIESMAQNWLSWNGKKRGTAGAQLGHSEGTKKEPKSNIYDTNGHSEGTVRAQEGHTTIQNSELRTIHTDHSLTSFENVSGKQNGISKPKKKSVSKKQKFESDTWQYLFSEDFYRHLVSNEIVSDESVTEAKIQSGAATFDLMLRTTLIKPNPDTSEIAETMIWLLSPTCWWMTNRAIRSPNKLLENHKKNGCTYYETIRGQFLAEQTGRNGASRSRGIAEAVARQMAPGSFFS